MSPRLLIINASSPFFFYIPMGTFGLCDYLEKHDIPSRIFNPALYPDSVADTQLQEQLRIFAPTHVALVFHWQETADGLLDIASQLKQWKPDVPVIVGGFTAGYFGRDLMSFCSQIDFLVHGDPEFPLRQLLYNQPPEEIANLTYRDNGEIKTSSPQWLIDEPTLDSISFTRLKFLHDSSLYIKKINTKLGFPLFLGRGCAFNCKYCGGSRHAFSRHSHRKSPITRSIPSIVRDLHTLKQATDTIYICYENTTAQILSLFRAIGDDRQLRGHFTLHYGAWHLPDNEFVQAYRDAFNVGEVRPIFEFSPEVISDTSRREIKGNASYNLAPLLDSCRFLSNALDHRVRIELFFSRYHPTEGSVSQILKEIKDIYSLKHRLFLENLRSVRICYDHLSTDVASRYWSDHHGGTTSFSEFLETKHSIDRKSRYPFPVDNLCFYTPEGLTIDELTEIEAVAQALEDMERYCHELFHVLFFLTGSRWIDELISLLPKHLKDNPSAFFCTTLSAPLLTDLTTALINREPDHRFTFLKDLVAFTLQKRRVPPTPEIRETLRGESNTYFLLDRKRRSIHQHDYLDLDRFLTRLKPIDTVPLAYERTVYLYLDKEIIALPHRSYRNTVRFFESGGTRDEYRKFLEQTFDPSIVTSHLGLLDELVEKKVVLPQEGR